MPQVAPCWRACPFCSVASWRVLRSVHKLTRWGDVENQQLVIAWRCSERKLQSCMFATSGGFAQFDKLRDAA